MNQLCSQIPFKVGLNMSKKSFPVSCKKKVSVRPTPRNVAIGVALGLNTLNLKISETLEIALSPKHIYIYIYKG